MFIPYWVKGLSAIGAVRDDSKWYGGWTNIHKYDKMLYECQLENSFKKHFVQEKP